MTYIFIICGVKSTFLHLWQESACISMHFVVNKEKERKIASKCVCSRKHFCLIGIWVSWKKSSRRHGQQLHYEHCEPFHWCWWVWDKCELCETRCSWHVVRSNPMAVSSNSRKAPWWGLYSQYCIMQIYAIPLSCVNDIQSLWDKSFPEYSRNVQETLTRTGI